MKKSFVRSALVTGALMAAALVPSVASAGMLTFNLNNSSGLSVAGNAGLQTAVSGPDTASVRISAWTLSGASGAGTVSVSTLGAYGANGVGATSTGEDGNNGTHTIDNQGSRDFIVLQFDRAVKLDMATFTPFALTLVNNNTDTDFTVGVGTTLAAWNAQPSLAGMSSAALTTMFGGTLFNYAGSNVTNSKALNPANAYGNIWLIGASFNNPDAIYDSFKLSNVTAINAPVPEASTWMLMIAGFGVVGGSMRRKSKGIYAVA
jgi:hypothetical protein